MTKSVIFNGKEFSVSPSYDIDKLIEFENMKVFVNPEYAKLDANATVLSRVSIMPMIEIPCFLKVFAPELHTEIAKSFDRVSLTEIKDVSFFHSKVYPIIKSIGVGKIYNDFINEIWGFIVSSNEVVEGNGTKD